MLLPSPPLPACLPVGHLFHPPLRPRRLLPSSYLLLSFSRVTTRSIPRPCFLETSFSSWPSFLKTIFFSLFFPLYYIFSVVLFNEDSRANRAYVASELGRNSVMKSSYGVVYTVFGSVYTFVGNDYTLVTTMYDMLTPFRTPSRQEGSGLV